VKGTVKFWFEISIVTIYYIFHELRHFTTVTRTLVVYIMDSRMFKKLT